MKHIYKSSSKEYFRGFCDFYFVLLFSKKREFLFKVQRFFFVANPDAK